MQGYATSTTFTVTTSGWVDAVGIAEYNFYYSFDSGDTYLPINDAGYTDTTITQVFNSVY